LPPPSRRAALMVAGFVSLVAFVVYLRTLAPGVTFVDSGELIVAARNLGVAHPPGTPLYVLLAHLATLLPLGSVAFRANLASAVFAALAAGVACLAARESVLDRRGTASGPVPQAWTGVAPLLCAGIFLAFSRTLWWYGTLTEVYTLNTLLLAGIFWLMFRWRRGAGSDRFLLLAAALFGLALGVHHATIGLSLPALAALVIGTAGLGFFRGRRLARAAAVSVSALVLVYSYLPLAARRWPVMNWGDPQTLERIAWHVTGRQYYAYFAVTQESMAREAAAFLSITSRQFGLPWLPILPALALLGLARLWKRDRSLVAALVLLAAANLGVGLVYAPAEDKDGYYLPAFLALVLAAAHGGWALLAWAGARRRALAAAVLVLLPATALLANFRVNDHSRFRLADDYLRDVLDGVGEAGLLLTADWQVYSPLLYLRDVEGLRRDVTAIDVHLLRRSWYFGQLRRAHPVLMARVKSEADEFLEDLEAWEHDPDLYQRDTALNRRINDRFYRLVMALVERHRETAPVYVTGELGLPGASPDPGMSRLLVQGRALVPRGLVFELAAQPGPAGPLPKRVKEVFELPVPPDDVVALKVRPACLAMVTARGTYLAKAGDLVGARESLDLALSLDPGYAPAREALTLLARPRGGE
jgi:hypothetical protein